MATYSSYKRIYTTDSIVDGAITDAKLAEGTRKQYGVKWVFGSPSACTSGCCCLWSTPDNVGTINATIWGAGGNGHGACSCNRCHHYAGAAGGTMNSKTVSTAPGCSYRLCAGGVYPCCERDCIGCQGCASSVCGYNMCNLTAVGGHGGMANTAWSTPCNSYWTCCVDKGDNNGDFGGSAHVGAFSGVQATYGSGQCHCRRQRTTPMPAVGIGTDVQQSINYCWSRCGCWTVPYGHGGQGGMTSYCGSCCANGGTGGSGLVKITYW